MKSTKHVFLVEGSGNPKILKQVINYFREDCFSFVIHWDKKSDEVDFSEFENVSLIDRRDVFLGTDSQVLVEKDLFEFAIERFPCADWFHLISESDVPLMSKQKFLEFFSDRSSSDVEFDGDANQYEERIKYYFPIRRLNLKNSHLGLQLHRLIKATNMLMGINRLREITFPIFKGSNWVSLTNKDARKLIAFKNQELFLNSSLADELYVQTILGEEILSSTETIRNGRYLLHNHRYIDWEKGNPYVFEMEDFDKLIQMANSGYTFVRKIKSVRLTQKLLEYLENYDVESEGECHVK